MPTSLAVKSNSQDDPAPDVRRLTPLPADKVAAALSAPRLQDAARAVWPDAKPAASPEAASALAGFGLNAEATPDAALKHLAARALNVPGSKKHMNGLSRLETFQSAALARLFGLDLAPLPNRTAVRFALARQILMARFPESAALFQSASASNARPHALIAAVILGLAGGAHKTLTEAETQMLSTALGVNAAKKNELAAGIVRAATQPRTQKSEARALPEKLQGVEDFAAAVRRVAKRMETQPYSGRVAIAQVYDAGLAQGMDFGALDEFKKRVAEACRAGHLDLERYDIAGPLDPAIRDRSRTPFGRDERHFIVNRWS